MEYYMYYTAREVFYVYNAIYSYMILIIFMYNTRVLFLPIANEMHGNYHSCKHKHTNIGQYPNMLILRSNITHPPNYICMHPSCKFKIFLMTFTYSQLTNVAVRKILAEWPSNTSISRKLYYISQPMFSNLDKGKLRIFFIWFSNVCK